MPILVVSGDDDFITPVAQGAEVAAGASDAKQIVIAGAGHFPWLEAPDATFAAIRDFIRAT